jgi:spartin
MTSSPIPGAEGFLLLTLPDSHLSSPSSHPPTQRGPLALECVTIPVASPQADAFPDGRDVWLILRVGSFEMPISPTQTIYHSRSKRTYLFSTPSSRRVTVTLPTAHDLSSEQDLETFEVLMAQYSVLQETDPDTGLDDGDLKGRLVLVDEDDGQVLGSLAEEFNIKEDSRVHTKGKEKDPVIVEFPEGNQDVYVRSVQPEDDWILRSADYVSYVYFVHSFAAGQG